MSDTTPQTLRTPGATDDYGDLRSTCCWAPVIMKGNVTEWFICTTCGQYCDTYSIRENEENPDGE